MNYYSAMRQKIPPFAATWVDLPEITLSPEDKYMISLKSGILKKKKKFDPKNLFTKHIV